jgi:hypothetical protein
MVSLGVERDSKSPSFHSVFFWRLPPRVIAGGGSTAGFRLHCERIPHARERNAISCQNRDGA